MKNYNDFLNESSDMDISKLSDGMLKEIRKVFNEAKSGLSNADLQMLAKITMEIKKRGIKESLKESIINEAANNNFAYEIATPAPIKYLTDDLTSLFGNKKEIIKDYASPQGLEAVLMLNLSPADISKIKDNIDDVLIFKIDLANRKEI